MVICVLHDALSVFFLPLLEGDIVSTLGTVQVSTVAGDIIWSELS
jgi:isopentenyl phosphate kinase